MEVEEGDSNLCQPLLQRDSGENDGSKSLHHSDNVECDETGLGSTSFGEGSDSNVDNSSRSSSVTEGQDDHSENLSIGREILSIAVPALAGLAIDPLMTLADTAFVGRNATDATALAGMGESAALVTFSFYLFNFLCTVTTPLVSHRRASGNEIGAVEIGRQALSLAFLLGGALASVLLIFSDPLLRLMGAKHTGNSSSLYARSFLETRALAAPAVFLISASTGILRGFLDTKTTFVVLLVSNLLNFSLDVILVGWLHMGPKGAAIATTTAEWICATSLLLVLGGFLPSADGNLGSNQHSRDVSTNWRTLQREQQIEITEESLQSRRKVVVIPALEVPSCAAIKPLVVASSSVFVRTFMLQFAIAGAAAMATRNGGEPGSEAASASIAAHQVALQLWLLCSFVCDALAAASQALVADRLGRQDSVGVRNVSKHIFGYSLILGVVLATILGIGKYTEVLLHLFTGDEETQEALRPLLFILIIAQPLNSFVFAADGILQGASLFTYQAKSMVLSVCVAFASFFFFHCYREGGGFSSLKNIWYALLILQLIRGITSLWKLLDCRGPIDILHRRQGEPP